MKNKFVWRIFLVFITFCGVALATTPFWGDKTSQSVDVLPTSLKPGQFVWGPQQHVPTGPIVVVVSLTEQLAYVYRNGLLIGYSTVSTGKSGFATPTGVFTTLQKEKEHYSSLYHNAAMPDTQRLTWGGVSLHAGGLPGYPSSHGCVHLPSAFAALLYDASPLGMTVVICSDSQAPVAETHPSFLSPVDAKTGKPVENPQLAPGQEFRWEPDKSPTGPVSVLLSGADQRLFVYRNGVEIGRSRITVNDPEKPLGIHVFVVTQPAGPNGERPKWVGLSIPGHADEANVPMTAQQRARITVPPEFLKLFIPLLTQGTTLMVTDDAVLPSTTGVPVTVMTNEGPEKI
jgi:L,D-transpeptidase catalytic domain